MAFKRKDGRNKRRIIYKKTTERIFVVDCIIFHG